MHSAYLDISFEICRNPYYLSTLLHWFKKYVLFTAVSFYYCNMSPPHRRRAVAAQWLLTYEPPPRRFLLSWFSSLPAAYEHGNGQKLRTCMNVKRTLILPLPQVNRIISFCPIYDLSFISLATQYLFFSRQMLSDLKIYVTPYAHNYVTFSSSSSVFFNLVFCFQIERQIELRIYYYCP